jgi:hypothetical protein
MNVSSEVMAPSIFVEAFLDIAPDRLNSTESSLNAALLFEALVAKDAARFLFDPTYGFFDSTFELLLVHTCNMGCKLRTVCTAAHTTRARNVREQWSPPRGE